MTEKLKALQDAYEKELKRLDEERSKVEYAYNVKRLFLGLCGKAPWYASEYKKQSYTYVAYKGGLDIIPHLMDAPEVSFVCNTIYKGSTYEPTMSSFQLKMKHFNYNKRVDYEVTFVIEIDGNRYHVSITVPYSPFLHAETKEVRFNAGYEDRYHRMEYWSAKCPVGLAKMQYAGARTQETAYVTYYAETAEQAQLMDDIIKGMEFADESI